MGEKANTVVPLLVPLDLIAGIRIRANVPLGSPGVFLAHGKRYPMMLAFNWADEPHLMMLGGDYAFHHFTQQVGHSIPGILVSGIEIIVDMESRYDPEREADPLGAVVLSEGKVCIVGIRSGDTFGDPHLVPVWDAPQQANSEAKAGFARWEIVSRREHEQVRIWSTPTKGGDSP